MISEGKIMLNSKMGLMIHDWIDSQAIQEGLYLMAKTMVVAAKFVQRISPAAFRSPCWMADRNMSRYAIFLYCSTFMEDS